MECSRSLQMGSRDDNDMFLFILGCNCGMKDIFATNKNCVYWNLVAKLFGKVSQSYWKMKFYLRSLLTHWMVVLGKNFTNNVFSQKQIKTFPTWCTKKPNQRILNSNLWQSCNFVPSICLFQPITLLKWTTISKKISLPILLIQYRPT